MSTISNLDDKRIELNDSVDAYKQDQSPAVLETAKTRGYEYAKLTGQVRRDNPTLTEDDLFSDPTLQSSALRAEVSRVMTVGPSQILLKDDFDGAVLDSTLWDILDPDSLGGVSVSNGRLLLDPQVNDTQADPSRWVFVRSKQSFPVGSKYRVRARNPQGRHAALIGFSNLPRTGGLRSGNEVGCSWYSRADAPDNFPGSYTDEAGDQGNTLRATSQTDYVILEIRRVSASVVEFYENNVLVNTVNNAVFNDEYSIFFGVDNGWYSPTSVVAEIDWVEVSSI